MRTRLAGGLLAVAVLTAGPAAQQPPATAIPPPQPPTFRVGVGAVRLDVTVIGRDGLPVGDLTREDFDVREDGVVQRVQLFQHVSLSGELPAGSDESLTIRSPEHARQEAERDDVRLLVIFVDDYHLRAGPLEDLRLRRDLVRFIQTEMRPLDLFAVMGPLTPISDLGLTRDKNALLKRVNEVQGRLGGFIPPRSVVEEAQMRLGPADLVRVRAQISLSALESLAVHLGGLRDGRKSILFVSQGPPLLTGSFDVLSDAREVIVAANRNNVTIHTFDPRQLGEAHMVSDANASLSADTGGRRIGLSNDFSRPLHGVMADASSYYLIGYESPSTAADGKFRRINVAVRRSGVRVIARNGYWAPRPEDLRTAAAAASEPVVPPDVAEALDSLRDQGRRIAVGDWVGLEPIDQRQSQVRVVFETLVARAPAPRVAGVELEVTGLDGIKTPHTPVEGPAGIWSARFNAAPGRIQLRATVKDTFGAVIDSWSRAIAVPDAADDNSQVGTPMVYRAASILQYRALMSGSEMPPSVTRRFRHTDRAIVRLALGVKAPVDAQLLNRRGVALRTMTVAPAPKPSEVQVELPLGGLAQADYLLRFTITAASGKTTRLVPFTLAP